MATHVFYRGGKRIFSKDAVFLARKATCVFYTGACAMHIVHLSRDCENTKVKIYNDCCAMRFSPERVRMQPRRLSSVCILGEHKKLGV